MENKRKHLEFIQGVISRMASNSFLLKGWTILLVAALFAFFARFGDSLYIFAVFVPLAAFWILDGFFLSQERLFRALYDHVRTLEEQAIDFSMDTSYYRRNKRNSWLNAILSATLALFYLPVVAAMVVVTVLTFVSD